MTEKNRPVADRGPRDLWTSLHGGDEVLQPEVPKGDEGGDIGQELYFLPSGRGEVVVLSCFFEPVWCFFKLH